jgi:hypothetical protein
MSQLKAEFDAKVSERIQQLAKLTKRDPSDVLNRALALYDFALNSADPKGQHEVTVKVDGVETDIAL